MSVQSTLKNFLPDSETGIDCSELLSSIRNELLGVKGKLEKHIDSKLQAEHERDLQERPLFITPIPVYKTKIVPKHLELKGEKARPCKKVYSNNPLGEPYKDKKEPERTKELGTNVHKYAGAACSIETDQTREAPNEADEMEYLEYKTAFELRRKQFKEEWKRKYPNIKPPNED